MNTWYSDLVTRRKNNVLYFFALKVQIKFVVHLEMKLLSARISNELTDVFHLFAMWMEGI
jgi:hypothetical protein